MNLWYIADFEHSFRTLLYQLGCITALNSRIFSKNVPIPRFCDLYLSIYYPTRLGYFDLDFLYQSHHFGADGKEKEEIELSNAAAFALQSLLSDSYVSSKVDTETVLVQILKFKKIYAISDHTLFILDVASLSLGI